MSESVFSEKSKKPREFELNNALGNASMVLKEIKCHLCEEFGSAEWDWKFYSKKAGWTLSCTALKRRVFHLIPRNEYFTIVFTYGVKATENSLMSPLPDYVKHLIREAKTYAEGTSFRLDIQNFEDVSTVKMLIQIKLES